jgi:hypothetical protein
MVPVYMGVVGAECQEIKRGTGTIGKVLGGDEDLL